MPPSSSRLNESVHATACWGRGCVGRRPSGFSLVELLVVITIILVLMALAGAGVSAARSSQRVQATRALIAKLDAIISQQYASYASLDIPGGLPQNRGPDLRQRITRDMPDRWTDVSFLAQNPGQSPSGHQRGYAAVWNSFPVPKRLCPGEPGYPQNPATLARAEREQFGREILAFRYSSAECLFMIIMRGGIANCLDCSALASEAIGDKDGDGAFEFLDAWGNPIGYILWPAALELPADSGTKFFSQTAPFSPAASGRVMRPLIYSAGPDGFEDSPFPLTPDGPPFGWFGFQCDSDQANLTAGAQCGDPTAAPSKDFAKPLGGASDNITNFDAESKR
jgi:prepilin-type N-terminal cleavage/methylation domain-containing protein